MSMCEENITLGNLEVETVATEETIELSMAERLLELTIENRLLRQGFKARVKCIGCVGGDPACHDCMLNDPDKYIQWAKDK